VYEQVAEECLLPLLHSPSEQCGSVSVGLAGEVFWFLAVVITNVDDGCGRSDMEVAAPVYRHKHISKMKDERHFDN